MSRRLIVLLVGVAFGGGCFRDVPVGVRELADGRRVPSGWTDFVAADVQDRAARRLHYDSIYAAEPMKTNIVWLPHRPTVWEMRWYRFWDGGQVLEKARYEEAPDDAPPTAAEGDDFRGAGVGRYSVVGGRIRMEFLGYDESGWTWSRRTGRVNEDGSFTIFPNRPQGFYGPLEPPRT